MTIQTILGYLEKVYCGDLIDIFRRHILLRYLLDAHTRISSEFSFKEGTLNFKVIGGKLGNQHCG